MASDRAIDMQDVAQSALGMQVGGKNAAIDAAAALAGAEEHGTGAVTEQHTGAAVLPVQDARVDLAADHQHAVRVAGADHAVSDRQCVDEPGAGGGDVEAETAGHAERRLHAQRRGREGLIRRAGGQDDRIDLGGCGAGVRKRGTRGLGTHECRRLVRGRDVALAYAGALADPLVRRIDRVGELVVADHALGQIGADTGEDRANGHCLP